MTKIVHYTQGMENIGDAVCAIGAFDGVHTGHCFLIKSMVADASLRGCTSVIVTFDIDPDELFKESSQIRKLLSNEDRLQGLSALGADYVLVVPFTRENASLPYEVFLDTVINGFMQCKAVHVGYDFRFGAGAKGNVEAITAWGASHDCGCKGYELWSIAGHPVSATRIRELLGAGEVTAAYSLLGRDHFMRGIVEHGRGAGRGFGIPTANMRCNTPYTPVKEGVYGGYVEVDGTRYPAAINVGLAPTFEDAKSVLEPHLIGFEGDLYGKEVIVSFVARLRDLVKFNSTNELIATVTANIAWVREHLS